MYTFGCLFVMAFGATIGATIVMARAKLNWWKALIPLPLGTFIYFLLLRDAMAPPYNLISPDTLSCAGITIGIAILAALIVMARNARNQLAKKESDDTSNSSNTTST